MKNWLMIVALLFGLMACKDSIVDVGNPDKSGNQLPSSIDNEPQGNLVDPTPSPTPTPSSDFQKKSENNWDEDSDEIESGLEV